jgi:hypothetical protein
MAPIILGVTGNLVTGHVKVSNLLAGGIFEHRSRGVWMGVPEVTTYISGYFVMLHSRTLAGFTEAT